MTELANKVKEAGVIGAGGAGFPTHIKIAAEVDTVVINGAECEPLLYGDQTLMEEKAQDIVSGLKMVCDNISGRTKKPVRAVIGVKEKYCGAIAALQSAIGSNVIEILPLKNVYPAGDEHFLVYEATGRIVPEGGIPLAVGAMVMNVGTLVQVEAASSKGTPVTSRLMTFGGAVATPCIAEVPIGTPFSEIMPKLGPLIDDYTLLVNGPMMGRLTTDLSEVTTKTTGGLFLLPKTHSHVRRLSRSLSTEIKLSKSVCEVCRYCTDFCPRFLQGHAIEPHKIMRVINYDRDLDSNTITAAELCCECGICDLWACPMALSPRVIFGEFKKKLSAAKIKNRHQRSELTVDEHRRYRATPVSRLVRRLGLTEYDHRPPRNPVPWQPNKVTLRLDTHIGAPSRAIVKKGDHVTVGDLVADLAPKSLGARYHASIAGTVTSLTDNSITIEAQK